MMIWVIPAFTQTLTWWGRWTPSIMLPTPQLPAQIFYLLLQLPCLLIMWDMTPSPWVTPLRTFSVVRLHHNAWGMFPISPSIQVNKLVLPLWANWFFPILVYVSYNYSEQIHCTLMFPQMAPIVRTKRSGGPSPLKTVSCAVQPWPKSLKFVREGNKQQKRALPEDKNKEERGNVIE